MAWETWKGGQWPSGRILRVFILSENFESNNFTIEFEVKLSFIYDNGYIINIVRIK